MEDDFTREKLLLTAKQLDVSLDTQMNRMMRETDLSGGQAMILCYLLRHHPEGICIRDLCTELGITHATLSLMISKLREKGYLSVQAEDSDRRRKRVTVTDKLLQENRDFLKVAEQTEDRICEALDSREQRELYRLQKKLLRNLQNFRGV